MRRSRSLIALCAIAFFSASALADYPTTSAPHAAYGWVPEYKKLYARLGVDINTTSENFANDGVIESLPGKATLTDTIVWVEPEYGIAQDWSAKLNLGFINRNLDTGAGGSGIADVRADVKWNVKAMDPIVTFDVILKLPAASSKAASRTDLALGDGSVDAGIQLHTGHQSGPFLFALSPGFLFRSGSYSYAFIGDAAFQLDFLRGFVRVFVNGIYSLNEMKNQDSSISKHDAAGAGGSYAILNGSPIGVNAGGKIGIKIFDEFYIEGGASHTVYGVRYPNSLNISIALFNAFDFFHPLPAKRVKEVPFDSRDSSGDDFYKGK